MSARLPTAVELARIAYGGCLLAAATLLPEHVLGERVTPRTRQVVRMLGARHIVQGAGTLILGARARRLGIAADLLHLASLAPIGLASGRRKMCLTDAVIESIFAGTEASLGRQ